MDEGDGFMVFGSLLPSDDEMATRRPLLRVNTVEVFSRCQPLSTVSPAIDLDQMQSGRGVRLVAQSPHQPPPDVKDRDFDGSRLCRGEDELGPRAERVGKQRAAKREPS